MYGVFFLHLEMKACPPENERNTLQEINISHLGKRKIIDSKVPAGRGYVNSQEGRLFRIHFGSSTYKIKRKKGIPESSVLVSKRAWKFPDENPWEVGTYVYLLIYH